MGSMYSRNSQGYREMFSALAPSTASPGSPLKPRFEQMLKSKRVRVVAAAAVFLSIILLLFSPSTYVQDFHGGPFGSSSSPVTASGHRVDWSRFAYVQYVTNTPYLCNSVMLFERLHTLGTKADKLMMYPAQYVPGDSSVEGRLLAKARDEYGVKLTPIEVQRRAAHDGKTLYSYLESKTKKYLSYPGRELYQATSFQPDSIRPGLGPRF